VGKLTRLVISSYLGPFILTFAIAMVFLILQFLWKYVDDLMGKGLEWYVIAELLFYASANLVPMALPLAILLSSIMVFGNLGESSELTAMRSAGLSLMRIMRPLIIFISFISLSAFFFANYMWPVANMKFRSLIFDIQNQKPALTLTEKRFYNDIPGFSIRVMEKSNSGDEFKDILIYDHSTGNVNYKRDIWAESGRIERINNGQGMIFHLQNGKIYEEVQGRMMKGGVFPYQKISFKNASLFFDLSSFQLQRTDVQVFNTHYEMMNMNQLASAEDSLIILLSEKREEMADNLALRFMFFRPASGEPIQKPIINPNISTGPKAFGSPLTISIDTTRSATVTPAFLCHFRSNEASNVQEPFLLRKTWPATHWNM
jgi:lipopolysaccharide export system permease protein